MAKHDNPLLADEVMPAFDRITAADVQPAMELLLKQTEAAFTELETTLTPTWDGLMVPLETIDDDLGRAWGAVSHLLGVRNSDDLRSAHAACQPQVVKLSTRMSQSVAIHDGMCALRDSAEFERLSAARQRIVTKAIRSAVLSGVALQGDERERFGAIQMQLAEAATTFSNHVLDATKAWSLLLDDPADVAGLPDTLLGMAAQAAREEHPEATADKGPWRITLDGPSVVPFFKHCRKRQHRESVYRAYISRAGFGEHDNTALIDEILTLRREKSDLLGFSDFASLSTARKMAGDAKAVQSLLEELLTASRDTAEREFEDLSAFAEQHPGLTDTDGGLKHWDLAFWAERLRQDRYDIDEEALRPYFPLPRVLEGLFALANRLFGVAIEAADGEAPIWHEDVRFFRVRGETGEPIAAFYLDPYSRPAEKRGGAWMDECVGRTRAFGALRLPVAHLVCNGTPPVDPKPSLMSFREVETLFHEFGHGLQHMLTRVDDGLASGIRNIEWDAVELPSQFMENWCYEPPTFATISGHWQDGSAVPEGTLAKLRAARTYRAASAMLRQLSFAMTDMALHSTFVAGGSESVFDVQKRIYERTSVLPWLEEDRFLCAFSHIFAGGYAAGYYSYKWAEVLSADAFSAFEEAGLSKPAEVARVGRLFRDTVLARGGEEHPLQVFEAFRGRAPQTDALLRHCGLSAQGTLP